MIVECETTSSRQIPNLFPSAPYPPEGDYDVQVGRRYRVYGMSLWRRGVLLYLIDPDGDGRPNWYPVNLFTIRDNTLPANWIFEFTERHQEDGVSAVWGYRELVLSEEHYDGLVERDREALSLFAKRKAEADSDAP